MKTKDGDGTGSCVQGEPDSRERVCLLPVEQVFACEMVELSVDPDSRIHKVVYQ